MKRAGISMVNTVVDGMDGGYLTWTSVDEGCLCCMCMRHIGRQRIEDW